MTRAEPLLSVAEVARLWDCSKNFVYDQIAAGRLRSVALPCARAKTRIPESAIAEFVAAHTRTTKGRAA